MPFADTNPKSGFSRCCKVQIHAGKWTKLSAV